MVFLFSLRSTNLFHYHQHTGFQITSPFKNHGHWLPTLRDTLSITALLQQYLLRFKKFFWLEGINQWTNVRVN